MKNKGLFYVHETELENADFFADVLHNMRFIPLRVEFHYDRGAFEYIGLSPMFDEINVGEKVPEYVLEMSRDQYGELIRTHVTRI